MAVFLRGSSQMHEQPHTTGSTDSPSCTEEEQQDSAMLRANLSPGSPYFSLQANVGKGASYAGSLIFL